MTLSKHLAGILLCLLGGVSILHAGALSVGGFTQVKLEYQYTDYLKFAYPNPILFEYNSHDYRQPAPYINDFPENRVLAKVSQGLGINDVLHVKYQYSDLSDTNWQDLFNAKYVRNLSSSTEAHIAGQFTRGRGGFMGKSVEVGGKVDFAGFILADGSYGYYSNTSDSVWMDNLGVQQTKELPSDAHSLSLKLRQALSKSTAFQVKYDYFFAAGDRADFFSNTLTFWVSQYLPTKTAVHAEYRENWNGNKYRSWSSGLEIDQYLNWSSTLTLKGRFYQGLPTDPLAIQGLNGKTSFNSYSLSAILSHHLFAETIVMLKYRYYVSDQDIEMNTYLLGLQYIL
jgi:hypothetical protein